MADAAYHSKPGMSFHQLMDFAVSPAFYYRKHMLKAIPRSTSAAMEFGTAAHMAVLEPFRFQTDYILAPDEFLTPTGGLADNKSSRAWFDTIKPKRPIAPKDCDRLHAMRAALMEHDAAHAIITHPKLEVEKEWFIERNGITVKGCADIVIGESLYDFKTCKDIDEIEQSVISFNYTEQLAWYLWLFDFPMRAENCGLVCVEVDEPYRVKCLRPTQDRLDAAYLTCRDLFKQFQSCKDNDQWPGQPFPGWMEYQ